mgnify:CR=1 FL=1
MRKIVYETPSGGLCIVSPAAPSFELAAWMRLPQDAINPRWVDESEIPSDRAFRGALKHDLTYDMNKARGIHKEKLRTLRKPLLESLDQEYMRADEDGDNAKKAEIKARKQALRDVTADPAIASAQDVATLAAVIPDCLNT